MRPVDVVLDDPTAEGVASHPEEHSGIDNRARRLECFDTEHPLGRGQVEGTNFDDEGHAAELSGRPPLRTTGRLGLQSHADRANVALFWPQGHADAITAVDMLGGLLGGAEVDPLGDEGREDLSQRVDGAWCTGSVDRAGR